MKEVELKKWMNLARWAPSGGNAQPWQIKVKNLEKGEMVLFVDPQYRQNPSCMDFDGSATLIGLGAFVENLSHIVDLDNYFLQIEELIQEDSFFDFSLKIRVVEGSQLSDDERFISSQNTFTNRVTNRTCYLPNPVPQDFQQWIGVQAKKLNLSVKNLSHAEHRPQLMQIFEKLERVRWENRVFLKHLLKELRETTSEEDSKGVPFYQLDIKWSEIFLLQAFKKWPFTHRFLPLGVSQIISKEAVKKPLSTASFFCYLVGEKNSAESFFNLGRCLQRIWLAAEEKGLALQPMANHLIVYQALKYPEKFNLSLEKKRILNSVYQEYQSYWGIDLLQPAFGFRLGYPSAKIKPSCRRPVDKFVDF